MRLQKSGIRHPRQTMLTRSAAQRQQPVPMSSFFSRLRPSKRKAANNNPVYRNGNSNNSSSTSLAQRHHHQHKVAPVPVPANHAAHDAHGGSRPSPSTSTSSVLAPPPLFLQAPFVKAALVKGSFQTIVELPKFVDSNEWLALNIFEFNAHLDLLCTTLSDFMDPQVPMNAGPGNEYRWLDANKQAVQLAAPTYIDYTMSWIQAKFDDPTLFPTRQGVPFAPNFPSVVRAIYIQQFRIFAYIYYNLFDKIAHLSLEPHFNSLFCFFVSLGKFFGLLDRSEAAPLQALIQSFESQGKIA